MHSNLAGDLALATVGSRGVKSKTAPVLSDECVAELTETALEVALRQGVNRPSVEVEIALWHSLKSAAEEARRQRAGGIAGLKPDRKSHLATLTEAAYRTALVSGIKGSFIDLEIGLWNAFRKECFAAVTP